MIISMNAGTTEPTEHIGHHHTEQTKSLVHTTFLQRENQTYHHTYDEELLQYEYVKNGDLRSVEESKRLFRTGINGSLSSDPLRHVKYLFVASTTLATRFAIEGGLEAQTAYNVSDLFIQRMDRCKVVDEVNALQTNMIEDFTRKVAAAKKTNALTRAVCRAQDYIYYHLHEKITLAAVAAHAGCAPTYLSALFKKELGLTVQDYVRSRRIEAAKNMLLYSDYTLTEIAAFLAFSSTSHFVKVFREQTGTTPREFATQGFRTHWR